MDSVDGIRQDIRKAPHEPHTYCRQTGKTEALMQIIHEDYLGDATLFSMNARMSEIARNRYREKYPSDSVWPTFAYLRMKEQYEDRFRIMLPRRSYTIIRVDGRAFHTWTRGFERPYSVEMMTAMDATALALCEDIAGAQIGYVQSDEISILLTDFAKIDTHAWFDNNLQKLCSISASIATATFNDWWSKAALARSWSLAHFDSRVFQIPDPVEVENYFVSRQKDAVRNSVAMLAQGYCSPKELHGVSVEKMHDKIHEHGDNWAKHPARYKQGSAIVKMPQPAYMKETKVGTVEIPEHMEWRVIAETPIFTQNREWLSSRVPRHE